MKKLLVFALLPVVLFGLETVNLIKNHSFENDDDTWVAYTGTLQAIGDSAKANSHDSESAMQGLFSSSNDTRIVPSGDVQPGPVDSAVVIQGLSLPKKVEDIDSVYWFMKFDWHEAGFQRCNMVAIGFYLNASEETWIEAYYFFHGPNTSTGGSGPHRKVFDFELSDDTSWSEYNRSFNEDWIITLGISPGALLDSLVLVGYGAMYPNWIGQKVYWDDIRLMGYADYDVGVKEILSGDIIRASEPYVPVVRVKNFGREDADEFLVICELRNEMGVHRLDTIVHTLLGDTEDTLEFPEIILELPTFHPYTLTFTTVMVEPAIDECDEDDVISKTLTGTAIAEGDEGNVFDLVVSGANPKGVLRVSYTLPAGQPASLYVYDATGRRVECHTVTGAGSTTIPTLPSGVYFVRLDAGSVVLRNKVVICN